MPNGAPTTVLTHEQVTNYKIGCYRFVASTIRRQIKLNNKIPIVLTGDFNLVLADEKIKPWIKPISSSVFRMRIMQRIWGLFTELKGKSPKMFYKKSPYLNVTCAQYTIRDAEAGDTIDYCIAFNAKVVKRLWNTAAARYVRNHDKYKPQVRNVFRLFGKTLWSDHFAQMFEIS